MLTFTNPEELFDEISDQNNFNVKIIITSAKECEKVIELKKTRFVSANIILFTSEKSKIRNQHLKDDGFIDDIIINNPELVNSVNHWFDHQNQILDLEKQTYKYVKKEFKKTLRNIEEFAKSKYP